MKKKKQESNKKDERLNIRCTAKQKEQIIFNAKDNGRSVSDYMVIVSLVNESERTQELMKQVKKYEKKLKCIRESAGDVTAAFLQLKTGVCMEEAMETIEKGMNTILWQSLE